MSIELSPRESFEKTIVELIAIARDTNLFIGRFGNYPIAPEIMSTVSALVCSPTFCVSNSMINTFVDRIEANPRIIADRNPSKLVHEGKHLFPEFPSFVIDSLLSVIESNAADRDTVDDIFSILSDLAVYAGRFARDHGRVLTPAYIDSFNPDRV